MILAWYETKEPGFLFGYDIGYISGCLIMVRTNHHPQQPNSPPA